jgi:hypothetical protein
MTPAPLDGAKAVILSAAKDPAPSANATSLRRAFLLASASGYWLLAPGF